MAILWHNDPRAVERYAMAVGESLHQVETAATASRVLQSDHAERLVIIGPDVDLDAACELAEITRVERPEVGVVLLRRRLDVTLLAQALRAGVREVVPADDLTAVAEACRHSRDLTTKLSGSAGSAGSHEGRIVTVFSAKGGVGKTTFSTNLGAYLAATGSRTLLVDLDLAFGDVAISLQLLPERTMTDVVAMSGHLDDQGLASVVTRHPASGLDTVCAPAEPGEADRILGPTVGELLQGGEAVLRLRHRRHAAGVHRARPGRLRPERPDRAAGHARHPRPEEPAPHPRHARPARQPGRVARGRAEPVRCQGGPAGRTTSSPRSSRTSPSWCRAASTSRRR